MIKIIGHQNTTSFGGIHLVHGKVQEFGLKSLIDNTLGRRSPNAVFSYSDAILQQCYIALCGGDCAEDTLNLGKTFEQLKDFKVCSPDTILGIQKELSTPQQTLLSKNGNENQINCNDLLNKLMLKLSVRMGLLSSQQKGYTLDFDHQFLATEKADAKKGYKKESGYFPGVASIKNIPLYIENRNGNCHVSFDQLATIKRIAQRLKEQGIQVARWRMDSGSYIKDVLHYIDEQLQGLFYIRAQKSDTLLGLAANCEGWQAAQINEQHYQLNSFDYEFGSNKYRIVAYRQLKKDKQLDLRTSDAYRYLFIITNDRKWDEQTIIRFYNQRGNAERLFDIQNNDFNWRKLPFSKMEHNTVYLHIMAICNMMHQWLLGLFCNQVQGLTTNTRLKKFIFLLICIPAKVIRSGRRKIVKLFGAQRLNLSIQNTT